MPFLVICPGCQAAYDLPDTLRGKRLRCQVCKETFQAALPLAQQVKEVEGILDALPADPPAGNKPAGPGSTSLTEPGHRVRSWGEEDEDEPRPQSRSSMGLVIVLSAVGFGVFLVLAVGAAGLWALRARPAGPGPGPGPVGPTPAVPAPGLAPVLKLERVPAEELAGRPALPGPSDEGLPIPPDPPAAKAVDWSGVETVELPAKGEPQGVAADPAPAPGKPPKPGPFALEARAKEIHHLLFPREVAQAVIVSSRQAAQGKRVVRVERIDLASGRSLGTVSLYGRRIQNPISMFAPMSAVSPDGNLFAQIDVNGRQRIDVWSLNDGKHRVGFVAPGGPRGSGLLVRDVAFVDAEHLLVLSTPSIDSSPGQVVLWKLPEAKPIYRFEGTGMPWLSLSPGGKYLTADTATGYALLEARTGKVVGRLPFPKERVLKAGMTGFHRDGTRLAAEISMFGGGRLPGRLLVCWDLGKGTMTQSFGIQMPLLQRSLQWFGDSAILVGSGLMSLEHKRVVARYGVAGVLATSSPDGRLWYAAGGNENQPASLHARTLPGGTVRKVIKPIEEKQ